MALHHELPIYKATYELLGVAIDSTRNIPRDFKRQFGEKVRDLCTDMIVQIFRANVATYKVEHIEKLLENLQVTELLFRLLSDKKFISKAQYAKLIELSSSIGKQASGWKKSCKSAPAS